MQSFNEWAKMYGFYSFKNIPIVDRENGKAIRYVSKYCSKGMFENPLVKQGLVDKTFHLISKGLGKSYVNKRKYYHLTRNDDVSDNYNFTPRIVGIAKNLRVLQGNFYYAMPRYYKEKILGNKSRLSSAVADFLLAQSDDVYNTELREFQLQSGLSELEAIRTLARQESEIAQYEARNALSILSKFYNKSKI